MLYSFPHLRQYNSDGLLGGHVIMLGPNCESAAIEALQSFPSGLQIGGMSYLCVIDRWFSILNYV